MLFWYLFPSLLRNSGNKHQNNTLVSAETVRHSSTYIILYYISMFSVKFCINLRCWLLPFMAYYHAMILLITAIRQICKKSNITNGCHFLEPKQSNTPAQRICRITVISQIINIKRDYILPIQLYFDRKFNTLPLLLVFVGFWCQKNTLYISSYTTSGITMRDKRTFMWQI